jgi:hypothetical protein
VNGRAVHRLRADYRIKKLCMKLVIKTSFCYDARSEKHQITEKLLYLKNMMVGKLNYELPIALAASLYRQNCAIASKFKTFLPYFVVRLRRFSGGTEQIKSYRPGCKTSVICDFVLSSV